MRSVTGASPSSSATHEVQGSEDVTATYYHDVPEALAVEALRRTAHPSLRHGDARAMAAAGVAQRADQGPPLSRRSIVPAGGLRRVARERLGITPDEIDGGHRVYLSRPAALTDRLISYVIPRPTR
jgi:hypothetical protein